MSRGINRVILIGNVGQDPETRALPSGGPVTNVTLATTESWKDKNTGEQEERTEWSRLVFFNRLAEIAGEYLKKGSKIYVEDQLRTRQWEREGQKHYTTEIVAREMQMLDSRNTDAGARAAEGSPGMAPENNAHQSGGVGGGMPADFDDDIPFAAWK